MNKLEILEKKIRQAADQITVLKGERQKLQSELQFLETEGAHTRNLIRENNTLKEQKKTITHRIEKILKRINSSLPGQQTL